VRGRCTCRFARSFIKGFLWYPQTTGANWFSGVIINLCTCPPDTQEISHPASVCFFVLRKFAGSFKLCLVCGTHYKREKKNPWCWLQKKKNSTLRAQQLISTTHNILPLEHYVNWGYLLLHWEFIWKNNIVHGLCFLGSFMCYHVTCDAKVQLKFQPNLYFCRAVRCTANYVNVQSTVIWKRMCLSPPDSRPEHALIYCPGPPFLYKVWGGTCFICKRRLKLWSSGPSWNTFSSCPVWTGQSEIFWITQHG
jgi:hypothetical protein